MRNRRATNTPQSKMIEINNKFGNTGIKHQQGTSRILYDCLPLIITQKAFVLTFFENVKTRKFPFTNLPENKLQVGETFTIQDYYLSLIFADGNDVVLFERPFEYYQATEGLYRADMDFMIGENRVIKALKCGSLQSSFNYSSNFLNMIPNTVVGGDPNLGLTIQEKGHDVYALRTDLVIPPDIEFTAPIKFSGINSLPATQQQGTWYVMLTMEGSASLLAPRTTF